MGGYNDPKHSYRYSVEQNVNKQTYLKITSISCDKDNSKSQTLTKVSSYIGSLGFSLHDLKYKIVGICER